MKHLLIAMTVAMVPTLALADIEDNNIVVENYGTTSAKAYSARGSIGGGLIASGSRTGSGANAGGVDIQCAAGQSCSRNNIKVLNFGSASADGDSVSSGVRLWNK